MTTKVICPDCGAFMEHWGDCWRCPWSRVPSHRLPLHGKGAQVACGRPYAGGRTDIAAPIQGRTTL